MKQHFRVAAISFDHMHMGDNLRMVAEHPDCQVVGICDPDPKRLVEPQKDLQLSDSAIFTCWQRCIEAANPDFVILCPSTGDHALWVERLAPYGLPLLVEKPMAASLADADRMIEACQQHDVVLAINWPLVWVPAHRTAKRLVDEGRIGSVVEIHFYDGNRGPLWHSSHKTERTAEQVQREKSHSWFYKRESGGGSLLDYLGYGATLGTWYLNGAKPIEVTTVTDQPAHLEVDEHSVTIARYEFGLSKFETRWGTFTDPWIHQPQPKCGFVLVGTEGTLASYDYEPQLRMQDRQNPHGLVIPADTIDPPNQNPVQYFADCLEHGRDITGPLSIEISRIGQQIVDTAYESARQKQTLRLLE